MAVTVAIVAGAGAEAEAKAEATIAISSVAAAVLVFDDEVLMVVDRLLSSSLCTSQLVNGQEPCNGVPSGRRWCECGWC